MKEDLHIIKITKIYRHHVIYKNIRNKFKKQMATCGLIFACIICGSVGIGLGTSTSSLFQNVNFANTAPVNPLYQDLGGIIFTSSGEVFFKNNKPLKMITPIVSSEVVAENGELVFTVKGSIMVLAPEDSVVEAVGVLPNGLKYIELKHNNQISSRIENIDIAGVAPKQLIKKGKEIATAKAGGTITFSVYNNGIKVPNLCMNNLEISWEN